MSTHVYLDDLRRPPFGWDLVKTADACIAALETGTVEYLSLDHDLGEEHYEPAAVIDYASYRTKTGYDVVKWMVSTGVWPKVSITLHTANPVGRANMRALIQRYAPSEMLLFG